jgi:fibronectin-binding autotransporter adhesin
MNSFHYKTSRSNRARLLIGAVAALGGMSANARAAQVIWTGTTNGTTTADWQNAGNWNGVVPVNSTNTALFTNTGLYNSTTAATIDANSTFSIGEIQFSTTTAGTTTPPITVINSQNGTITLTNATGLLVQTQQTNPVVLNTNLALGNAAAGNATLFNTTQQTTIGGIISDGIAGISSSLVKTGTAALLLKGANTYTGTTTVQQNNIQLGADALLNTPGPLGNASSVVQLGNASTTATQNFGLTTTGKFTVARDISVYAVPAATGVASIGGSTSQTGTSTFTGQLTLGESANFQSSTTGAGTVDFTGQITGPGGVNKTATGAVTLDNANNNYLGATSVKAGTLLVNGTITGGGAVSVAAGTLGGTGSITTGIGASGVSVANGSTLAPGLVAGGTANSATAFTVAGDVTLDGALSIEADTDVSKLVTSGVLTLNADSSLVFTGTSALTGPAYVIASYGSLGGSGAFGSVVNEPAGYTLNYAYQGSEIALVASPTPETAAVAFLAMGSTALLKRRRRA